MQKYLQRRLKFSKMFKSFEDFKISSKFNFRVICIQSLTCSFIFYFFLFILTSFFIYIISFKYFRVQVEVLISLLSLVSIFFKLNFWYFWYNCQNEVWNYIKKLFKCRFIIIISFSFLIYFTKFIVVLIMFLFWW